MTLTQIDRYQIKKLLGQGGMGEVYQAFDPHLNREVVIKFINLESSPNIEWRQRFKREVQAAGSLNHPHIVTLYDVELEGDRPYVVMELLTGGNLRQRLQLEPLPWREALTLLRPLVDALAYAHNAGVIHRDVKPDNIMFAGNAANTLKLVDFGLARWQESTDGLTQAGTVMGTPAYMSPEQARGEVVDGRADIFAVGIILFETITGRNPQQKGAVVSTVAEVASDTKVDLSPLNQVAPAEVVNLVEKAVAKNRDHRYPTCEAMLRDLDHCLGDSIDTVPGGAVSAPAVSAPTNGPDIRVAGGIKLPAQVKTVLKSMFGQFDQVAVEAEFNRGLSGSYVFQVRPVENDGKVHLPAVIKIAPISLIQKEWHAYQTWVEHTLHNIARLDVPPVTPAGSLWGGLRYTLVGGGTFEVQSLYDYYQNATIDDLTWVLEKRLFRNMGSNWWLDNRANRSFQMQADYDNLLPVNLLIRPLGAPSTQNPRVLEAGATLALNTISAGDPIQLKGFAVTSVSPQRQQVTLNLAPPGETQPAISCRVHLKNVSNVSHYRQGSIIDSIDGEVIATRHDLLTRLVRQVVGDEIDLTAEQLSIAAGQFDSSPRLLPNPLLAYRRLLHNFITVNTSTIHGDLNLENILLDPATREVSLIDFATVRRAHALHDLLRLETEVVTKLIPQALAQANLPAETICPFYELLHHALLHHDPGTAPRLPWQALEKPFAVLRVIRRMARNCLFNSEDWQEYYQGIILYLLGALKFENIQKMPIAPLPGQTAFWGAAAMLRLLDSPPPPPRQIQRSRQQTASAPSQVSQPVSELESPFGTMRPDSKMYIERSVDAHCRERVTAGRAATLFIQAPRQMGKSSLMRRALDVAGNQGKPFAFIDFQRFPEHYFNNEESFLIEFCLMVGDALGLPEAIDRYWQGRRTNIMKCTRYVSDYILPQIDGPFILAMDEVERMLTSPFRSDFFGMLRTWHNDRVYDDNFARLTLFLCSSTEPYLFIENPNQSPFNVAEVFSLEDFTREEVAELNRRHASLLSETQLDELMDLINGHPFLTRLALYLLATQKVANLDTLLAQATDDAGPFGDHLRYYLLRVLQKPELKTALAHICRNYSHKENQLFYRLKGAGLVKKQGKQVVLRNKLYDRYFKERLNV